MQQIIISDTSCLILLNKIGLLTILKELYNQIIITPEIAHEFGEDLPNWFKIKSAQNKEYQLVIESTLDKGEASAITLALESENNLLILDDLKARKFAKSLGINYTGTLGILVNAKQMGVIDSLSNVLKSINSTNFRLSDELKDSVLKMVGEI